MDRQQWEYCLLASTPMSGLDHERMRIAYQVAGPKSVQRLEIVSDDPSPLAAIARLLNELGRDGWELLAYDTTTNRGVFKRPVRDQGGD